MAKLKLIDALRKRFKTPNEALAALGLDAATIAMDAVVHDPKNGQFTAESHPIIVSHRGKTYSQTGKVGTHSKSGEHIAEYTHHSNYGKKDNVESRVWHSLPSGKIEEDSAIKRTPRVAGDSKENEMTTKPTKLSPTALVAMGVLHGYLAPRLAQDSAIDLGTILKDVTAKNFASKRPYITTEIRRSVVGNLAADADVADLPEMLDQIEALAGEASETVSGGGEGTNPMADPDDENKDEVMEPEDGAGGGEEGGGEDDANEIREFLADKISPEDLNTVCGMIKASGAHAHDETDEEKMKRERDEGQEPGMDKKAMDAAIKAAITANDAKHAAVAEAQRIVRPYVGDLTVAFDSAEQVYRHTLDALGVPTKGLHKDALPAILAVQPKPGARPREQRIAQDAAAVKGFSERFPSTSRIGTM